MKNSAYPYKSADYDKGSVYRAECQLQCLGNNVDNIGILESLYQVGPIDAHSWIERPLNAKG